MGKAKYLLPAMHPKYLLKFFQFFLENWVFVDIIQYIPVDGLQRGWRQETATVTIHCLFCEDSDEDRASHIAQW